MPVQLPNPTEIARQEADRMAAYPALRPDIGLKRALTDCPYVDPDSLLAGLEDFHRERMAKVPSPTKYPESPAWVDHIVAVDRELKRLANLSDRDIAVHRSFGAYVTFRGFAQALPAKACDPAAAGKPLIPPPAMTERCRIAFLPESDAGALHIKNVDDPCTHWKGNQPVPKSLPLTDAIVDDGVGSGMHIDDEPEEIFPLVARNMLPHYAQDVPGAVEFYTRYKPFWGGCNVVLRDRQKRSVAIEKCSFNFIEVFHPGPDGRSHCSGMACRNPDSPQAKYQRAKRKQYLTRFGQPTDGPDQTFWDACDRAEGMLGSALKKLGQPARSADVLRLFTTPWPDGLSKEGAKLHPGQAVEEYTLITHAVFLDKNQYIRWQRDPKTLKMPAKPETHQY